MEVQPTQRQPASAHARSPGRPALAGVASTATEQSPRCASPIMATCISTNSRAYAAKPWWGAKQARREPPRVRRSRKLFAAAHSGCIDPCARAPTGGVRKLAGSIETGKRPAFGIQLQLRVMRFVDGYVDGCLVRPNGSDPRPPIPGCATAWWISRSKRHSCRWCARCPTISTFTGIIRLRFQLRLFRDKHSARGVRREADYPHHVQHDGGAFCLCGKRARQRVCAATQEPGSFVLLGARHDRV